MATINARCPAAAEIVNYAWNDIYFFVQDEWRVRPSLTLNLGLRYELPGNWINSLRGAEPAASWTPPAATSASRSPRCPSATPTTSSPGWASTGTRARARTASPGFLTGGDRLVVRGGYARTHDYAFLNIALNIASSFPQVAASPIPRR